MAISSIYNDVIGPVMRGPSSSHSAAACRIGRLLHDLMLGEITQVEIDYDPNGSLVTTHESQGTDMGLYGGLMGWSADDPKMIHYKAHVAQSGMDIRVNYVSYGAAHPNNYRIRISNRKVSHKINAISTGGGMMEIQDIDGSAISICGDYHELLIFSPNPGEVANAFTSDEKEEIILHRTFAQIRKSAVFTAERMEEIRSYDGVHQVCYLKPVLPTLSRKSLQVPFLTCEDMLKFAEGTDLALWELALEYECERGAITKEEVFQKMHEIAQIMRSGVEEGLQGKEYEDRILPVQSLGYRDKMQARELLDGGMLNTIILYTTAMMEVKSAMGVIVAAPTAGSCGTLPGTILGAADYLKASDEDVIKALLAAGMVGVFISEGATFAAEVAGCQAETGAGGAMAAAGLVTLMKGSTQQAVTAASLTLQNALGIICDPIGNRVEAPCLGKNVMASSNALSCANMALANYEHLIPFDEVVQSMKEVGDMMAHELTCTGLGGLAATPTGQAILAKLKGKAQYC